MSTLDDICEILSNAHVSYGYSIIQTYLVKKTSKKFSADDTIKQNVLWKLLPAYKPGCT